MQENGKNAFSFTNSQNHELVNQQPPYITFFTLFCENVLISRKISRQLLNLMGI